MKNTLKDVLYDNLKLLKTDKTNEEIQQEYI